MLLEGINPQFTCPHPRVVDTQKLLHKWVKRLDQRQAIWENFLASCTDHFEGLALFWEEWLLFKCNMLIGFTFHPNPAPQAFPSAANNTSLPK